MNKTQKRNYDNLVAQADMFGMEIDWESLRLIPVRPQQESRNTPWLDRWIFLREDKQWDHENQNNDGGE